MIGSAEGLVKISCASSSCALSSSSRWCKFLFFSLCTFLTEEYRCPNRRPGPGVARPCPGWIGPAVVLRRQPRSAPIGLFWVGPARLARWVVGPPRPRRSSYSPPPRALSRPPLPASSCRFPVSRRRHPRALLPPWTSTEGRTTED